MAELPFFEPIVEDEYHVIRTCSLYHHLRCNLSDSLKTDIFRDISTMFMHHHLQEASLYVKKIFSLRHPKKKVPNRKTS